VNSGEQTLFDVHKGCLRRSAVTCLAAEIVGGGRLKPAVGARDSWPSAAAGGKGQRLDGGGQQECYREPLGGPCAGWTTEKVQGPTVTRSAPCASVEEAAPVA
jgi:hypothetical protein